jgi:hypothetical protein
VNSRRCSHEAAGNPVQRTSKSAAAAVVAGALAVLVVACTPAATPCDPAAFHAIRLARAAHQEVTICGRVLGVGRIHRSRSGLHRAFTVDVGDREAVEVDANLDVMGIFPIRRGEAAVIRGEYYADPRGRDGLHWTHRTDRGFHPPGFVTLDGVTYR